MLITIEVPSGEIVVVVGPSGCGKITALNIINRSVEPIAGPILLDREDVTDLNADQLRRRIGHVIRRSACLHT